MFIRVMEKLEKALVSTSSQDNILNNIQYSCYFWMEEWKYITKIAKFCILVL